MHARISSYLRGVAAGLALLLLTGCDGGAAAPSETPSGSQVAAPAPSTPAEPSPSQPAPSKPATAESAEPRLPVTPAPADPPPADPSRQALSGPEPIALGGGDDSFAPPPNPYRDPNYDPRAPKIVPTLARLTFTETSRDFGPVTDTEKKKTSFEFVNAGPEPLEIIDVKTSCSCTVPRLTKRKFAPGEGGVIDVTFDPKQKSGDVTQKVTIISNSRDGQVELEVTANVRPLIAFDRYARFGVIQLFEEHRMVVPLRYTDPDLVFDDISVNDVFIKARLLGKGVVDSGEGSDTVYRADLELTVSRDHPWGGLFARRTSITVTGRWRPGAETTQNKYTMFVLGSVFGELHASPQVAGFAQTKRQQSIQKVIRVTRPGGGPFKLERAWVTDMRTISPEARIEQISATEWRVVLTAFTTNPGEISGTLHIRTNVSGEELLKIPISGRVG